MKRPVLVFDGDCGFCRRWIDRWRHVTGERVEYAPSQEVASRFPQAKTRDFETAVQLFEVDGRRSSGAEAVFRALAYAPGKSWPLRAYLRIPGVRAVAEWFYRRVARNRVVFSWLTYWLWGDRLAPPTYELARRLFVRLMGVAYLAAFVSFGAQARGLVGENGILPAARFLERVREAYPDASRFLLLPTLGWLGAGDTALIAFSVLGAAASAGVIAGLAPGAFLSACWVLYLSIVSLGGIFLGYQWESLLLEAGFLSVFFAARGSRPFHFLLKWLLFRLMFSSGVVKLLSGDESWRALRALDVHYETQPLPSWIGYLAHQLPEAVNAASTALMFAIELGAPFLIFAPARPRLVAFLALAGLQVLIALTGNYAYFNLVSFGLCLLLLEDAQLSRVLPRRLAKRWKPRPARERAPGLARTGAVAVAAALLFAGSTARFAGTIGLGSWVPGVLSRLAAPMEQLRLVSGYGLFAVMTTERHEITIEGSHDQKEWKAYALPWKPNDAYSRPRFVAPHQPRLDWQLWFSALTTWDSHPWFRSFLSRLLEGRPEVLGLLAHDPFAGNPPRFVRATIRRFRFTGLRERWETGRWWNVGEARPYSPVLTR
jgi:predicted DCC family thiol-disulfide oxidoreductase YuxK